MISARHVAFALALLLVPATAQAEGFGKGWRSNGRILFGGFGHVSLGFNLGGVTPVGDTLADPSALGGGGDPGVFSGSLSGGGKMIFLGGLLLGGRGGVQVFLPADTSQGEAQVTVAGGGLDLGYVIYDSGPWMAYPLIGISGYSVTVTLKSTSEQTLAFGTGNSIQPGGESSFESGFVALDIGGGVQWMLHDGNGGFQLGAEAGLRFGFAGQEWIEEGAGEVPSVDPADQFAFFLRLTVGGGGYLRR